MLEVWWPWPQKKKLPKKGPSDCRSQRQCVVCRWRSRQKFSGFGPNERCSGLCPPYQQRFGTRQCGHQCRLRWPNCGRSSPASSSCACPRLRPGVPGLGWECIWLRPVASLPALGPFAAPPAPLRLPPPASTTAASAAGSANEDPAFYNPAPPSSPTSRHPGADYDEEMPSPVRASSQGE